MSRIIWGAVLLGLAINTTAIGQDDRRGGSSSKIRRRGSGRRITRGCLRAFARRWPSIPEYPRRGQPTA